MFFLCQTILVRHLLKLIQPVTVRKLDILSMPTELQHFSLKIHIIYCSP